MALGAGFKGRLQRCSLCISGTGNEAGARSVLIALKKKKGMNESMISALPSETSVIKFLFIFGQNLPPQYLSLLRSASGITLTHSKPCLGCRNKRANNADSVLLSWTWSRRDKNQVNL